MNEVNKISNETKIDILSNHVEPAYKKDVIELISGKRCWRITGQVFETVSKVFVAIGSIVSFAAGVYNETTLSFVAGAISTVSLATLQFASFSYRENKKQSTELNSLLKNIDLATLPTIDRTVEDNYNGASMRQTQQSPPKNEIVIPRENYMQIMNEIYRRGDENELLKKELISLREKIQNQIIVQKDNGSSLESFDDQKKEEEVELKIHNEN